MNSFLRRCAAALAVLGCAYASTASAVACSDSIQPSAAVLANGFGADLRNTRNTPSRITSANVASLQTAWVHAADASGKRGAPAATTQAVFFAAGLELIAANRATGCRYWTYTIPSDVNNSVTTKVNQLRASSVYYVPPQAGIAHPRVYAGDQNGVLYALDAVDGHLLWSKFMGSDPLHHFLTGGFQFDAGVLYVPVASNEVVTDIAQVTPCCTTHGMLHAVDAETGAIRWTYHVTPDAVWQADIAHFGPNGGSVWGVPAIDTVRKQVYIGTGQNYTPPDTGTSDAVIALDMASGREKWRFQATANDWWNGGCQLPAPLDSDCVHPEGSDFDFGAPPILANLPGGGQAIVAGAKNGVVYSLNPDTGALNWSQRLGAGGNLGGIHWGMAVDARQVYVAVSDVEVDKVAHGSVFAVLRLKLRMANLMVQVDGASPGVYALDLASGKPVWSHHGTHRYRGRSYDSIYSAAVSVTNDVVLAGSLDGELVALRSSDGAPLWSFNSAYAFTDVEGRRGNGGTIDQVGAIVADGDLLLNSGYDQFGGVNAYQVGPGNALFVLRLP